MFVGISDDLPIEFFNDQIVPMDAFVGNSSVETISNEFLTVLSVGIRLFSCSCDIEYFYILPFLDGIINSYSCHLSFLSSISR